MPDTLTPVSQDDTANVVVPIGTDKRKALTVRTPLQALLNTAQYLKDLIANLRTGAVHMASPYFDTFNSPSMSSGGSGSVLANLTQVTGTIGRSGTGGFNKLALQQAEHANADQTVERNCVHIMSNLDNANCAWTLSEDPDALTGAGIARGDWVVIALPASGYSGTLTLKKAGGSTIMTMTAVGAARVMLVRNNGNNDWQRVL